MLSVILLCACAIGLVSSVGPAHPSTKGGLWPQPQRLVQENVYYTFDPEHFHVELIGHNCTILSNRIRHYIYQFKQLKQIGDKYREDITVKKVKRGIDEEDEGNQAETSSTTERQEHEAAGLQATLVNVIEEQEIKGIEKLIVNLLLPCEEYPHIDMDESYNLTVATNAVLTSSSVWGIIRGLETFSQLFYFADDFQEIRVNASEITDAPAYKHRGLLLDTSRHYIPVRDILTTLEAMAMNKMNVFHWHIVDDQSFPYQSERFPDLSVRGAYHKSMVYTKSDIEMIIDYARERGIRVIPEFDVPGHTQSWGEAYPNLLTECYRDDKVTGKGPMDPVRNTTYKLVRHLLREVQDLFPDHYIHVGGDEVDLSCWASNPELVEWMTQHNVQDVKQLHSYFMARILPLLEPRSNAIVWQEVFEEEVPLTNNTLIQVWKNWNDPGWHMYKALKAGYRVLSSSYWYLDHLGETFEKMLRKDPRAEVHDVSFRRRPHSVNLGNLIGGEACMWSELVDETNLHSRVWPRASAAAERLWTGPPVDVGERTLSRIEEHVCRMKRRGVHAGPPTGPGFCLA